MNCLFLNLAKDGLGVARGFDSEIEPIPLDAVFATADPIEVWLLNLPGPTGERQDYRNVVPVALARLLHAGACAVTANPKLWPLTANPKANNKDHTD